MAAEIGVVLHIHPHFFYDFLSFLMFSLIFMNMIICMFYQKVKWLYLGKYLVPSLVLKGNGQLK